MGRQNRVTRLINYAGALERLREAEFFLTDVKRSGHALPEDEREVEALKQNYLDLHTSLTVSDRNRLGTASFEALVAAKRIVREWKARDDEFYGHVDRVVEAAVTDGPYPANEGIPGPPLEELLDLGAAIINPGHPVLEAARNAIYPSNWGEDILIEGTETSLRCVHGPLPDGEDLTSMVRQLTEKLDAGTLPKGVLAFNRYCAWSIHQAPTINIQAIADCGRSEEECPLFH